jgi:hypothetical protein
MATRKSYFYNSTVGDRKYNADSMIDWLSPFFTTGVFNNCFRVTANGAMNVTIEGGYCNIQGRVMHQWDADVLDIPVASGSLSRIDIAVIRRDDIKREIYPLIVSGGFAAVPVRPALVRENGIYDIQLAQWTVRPGVIVINPVDITDTRMDAALCGWVVSTVTPIDFSQITAQFEAFFAEYRVTVTDEYKAFVNQITGYFVDYTSMADVKYSQLELLVNQLMTNSNVDYGNLSAWIDTFKSTSQDLFNLWYGQTTTAWYNDFYGWFSNIQGMLSGDIATNLSNAVMMLQEITGNLSQAIEDLTDEMTTENGKISDRITEIETYIKNNLWFSTVAWLSNSYFGTSYLSA